MHPSYEDRPGASDGVFAAIDDAGFERHVAAWSRAFEAADAAECDVLHLHHLTPLHEAAARVAPGVPIVTHLHGTELLMLEEIADGAPGRMPRHGRGGCAAGPSAPSACSSFRRGQVDRAVDAARRRRRSSACSAPTALIPSASTCSRSTAPPIGATTSWTSRAAGRRRGGGLDRLHRGRDRAAGARPRGDRRQPLHRGQAHRAAGPRVGPRPARGPAAGRRVAGPARRLSGRVGGRASR